MRKINKDRSKDRNKEIRKVKTNRDRDRDRDRDTDKNNYSNYQKQPTPILPIYPNPKKQIPKNNQNPIIKNHQ
jgi:hypothetical protein